MTSTQYNGFSTTEICRYYIAGDIEFIPEEHINRIMGKCYTKLKRGMTDTELIQKRSECDAKCKKDPKLMVNTYLAIS